MTYRNYTIDEDYRIFTPDAKELFIHRNERPWDNREAQIIIDRHIVNSTPTATIQVPAKRNQTIKQADTCGYDEARQDDEDNFKEWMDSEAEIWRQEYE